MKMLIGRLFLLLHNDQKSLKGMGKIQDVVIVAAAGFERGTRNMARDT